MTKRNPIIADLRPHLDGIIPEHGETYRLTNEARIWSDLIGWALKEAAPVKKARYYGFRVSTRAQLIHAQKVLDRIATIPAA